MHSQILPALSALIFLSTSSLVSAETSDPYINSVCFPPVTPAPPCQAIIDIESACTPNGTLPIDYIAHAECMCGGGFFSNWLGCLNCFYVHGNRTAANVAAFHTILSSASSELCTGTPTASFADIFNNISNSNGPQDASATGEKDQYPSQTAVSLYYTASGNQGPGSITGSATLATKTGAANTNSAATTSSGSSGTDGTAKSSSGSSGSSSVSQAATKSSSSAGAAATKIIGGLLAVVAGGVIAAL